MNYPQRLMFPLLAKLFCKKKSLPKNLQLGRAGEDFAVQQLKNSYGFEILHRNWRSRESKGEIDLIAVQYGVLVFCEIRTRSHQSIKDAYCSINYRKKKILKKTFIQFLNSQSRYPKHYRFDICVVLGSHKESFELHHFKNIPLF